MEKPRRSGAGGARRGGRGGGGGANKGPRGRGGGGKKGGGGAKSKKEPVPTAEELDKELDSYREAR